MAYELECLPENYNDLKAFTVSLLTAFKHQALQVEALKFQLLKLKRWRFGAHSEQLDAEQLALWQTELESDIASATIQIENAQSAPGAERIRNRPHREKLPDWLPRVDERHELGSACCQHCGLELTQIGEEISEQLDMIPAQFFVRRHIRPKYACRSCETVTAAPMPNQPIDKGIPAAGLLAQVLISKYADHCPLNRQEGIYARMGVALSRSTMAGWIGQLEMLLQPLVERLHEHLRNEPYLQADETTVPVLEPGHGKARTGYLWAYRSGPWSALQAVVFDYQPTRGGQWPKRFLAGFAGVLQVDGYAGYHELFQTGKVIEAGCVAHARRQFFEVFEATQSPLAQTALLEIAKLYQIEEQVKGLTAEERATLRRSRAGPILASFKQWLETTYAQSPPRSALAKAIGYTLKRWAALTRYLDDGMINIDQNPVERSIRPIAVGRGNWLFCGSEGGGRRAALIYSLIETAKLNGLNPYQYFVDILTRLPSCKHKDLDSLLPYRRQHHSEM